MFNAVADQISANRLCMVNTVAAVICACGAIRVALYHQKHIRELMTGMRERSDAQDSAMAAGCAVLVEKGMKDSGGWECESAA